MKVIDIVAAVFLLFGGLNWGMVGVADFNVIMWVFIAMYHVQHFLYVCMGLSAIWVIIQMKGIRRRWCVQAK